MPINDKRDTSPALSDILEGLLQAEVDFILVGGLAAVIQGAPVTTLDVDIVHSRKDENIAKLFVFLNSINAIYRRPDDKTIKPKSEDFAGTGHTLLSTRLGPLDVLASIEQGQTYESLIGNTVEIDFRGYTLRVLDIKQMIKLKKGSKHPTDRQRIPVLEETLRQLAQTGDKT